MAQANLRSLGVYLPLLRFDRKVARSELRWSGLGGSGRGRRAVAGWDEDALTMAVEAARPLEPRGRAESVVFASTSAPFQDRSMAGLAIEALRLDSNATAIDVANSRRAAVTALLKALKGGVGDAQLAGHAVEAHAHDGACCSELPPRLSGRQHLGGEQWRG